MSGCPKNNKDLELSKKMLLNKEEKEPPIKMILILTPGLELDSLWTTGPIYYCTIFNIIQEQIAHIWYIKN